jgi:hypothetical protein
MVELEPIPAEEDRATRGLEHQGGDLETHGLVDMIRDMTRHDARASASADRAAPALHRQRTGAPHPGGLGAYLPKFVKVMPVDYRRALEKMAARKNSARPGTREGTEMGKPTGFMEIPRQDRSYRPVAERITTTPSSSFRWRRRR